VEVTVNKVDEANIVVSSRLDNDKIEAKIDTLARSAGKELKVDGFRQGKVPPHIVKKMHGEKLKQDAQNELIQAVITQGAKEANINPADMLGQPTFKKYDEQDNGIEVEIEISIRPQFDTQGYMDTLPTFEKPTASDEAVDAKLTEIAGENAPYEKIEEARPVEDGDMTLIDFEGFVDGVAFDGGKAEKFNLKIGSGQFIPGFEEQLIGLNSAEEKTVTVTFPAEYQSADLAGKEAQFKVTLHEIQAQGEVEIDDALAKKLLQGDENATVESLKEKIKEQIESTETSKLYNEELKPKLVEALVAKFDFALPNNIVDQEIDAKINAKARQMSQEELETYKDNEEKINELRESVREEATASVKATFIVDALAKLENISVDDQEVSQAIYYESMMGGQDPQEAIKYYQENNLLPAVKMGMIEDKLFGKMLGLQQ